jgi:hypothetical protein
MKRIFAAVITVMMASASIWLAAAPAYAKPKPPKPPKMDVATIQVVPKWTYQGGGKLAVITKCSDRQDLRVVSSKMLPHPVNLRGTASLLIRVTDKTKPGKYAIALWCVTKKGQVDALDVKTVKILGRLKGWKQRPAPPLPRCFMATVTVQSGPPVVRKPAPHGKKKPKKGQHSGH